jgi:endonuclease G
MATNRGCDTLFVGGQKPVARNAKLEVSTTYLCYEGFATMYSGVTRTPLWSAKHITADIGPSREAPYAAGGMLIEDQIPLAERSTESDFLQTSYYDMALLTTPHDLGTKTGRSQSLTYANAALIEPTQAHARFLQVRNSIRQAAHDNGEYYVFTGVLFEGDNLRMVNDRLIVPTAFYVAAYQPGAPAGIAVVVANDRQANMDIVSLAEIEQRSGFNLFPTLSEDLKARKLK